MREAGELSTNVLTLRLDERSQGYFERLRQIHFPVKLNFIPAHPTLFHKLPNTPAIGVELDRLAEAQTTFSVEVTGMRSLGGGVAFTLTSPVLVRLHSGLAASFGEWLTAQDRQKFMPHIVVQNKVTGEQARVLLEELKKQFRPTQVEACGVDLWEYLGGPWRHLQTYRFQETECVAGVATRSFETGYLT